MSLEDLARTLESKDDNDRFKILLELMVASESTNRVILDLLIDIKSNGDEKVTEVLQTDMEDRLNFHREILTRLLFEKFGHNPEIFGERG